jgi:alpha-L-fucosidase
MKIKIDRMFLATPLAWLIGVGVQAAELPVTPGPFQPTWESLAAQYQCPEWFRDAKFGIWAVWGPQCQPEDGDWYARSMYMQGSAQNKFHVEHYGPPSKFGFKDVIHEWKGENFHPDELLAFYKKSGAKYFLAMANHHDNFDMYDSKYQPWNSVAIGPKKDIIGMWARAARKNGLRFAVSVHATHTWTWYEPAQGADKTGPLAGVPYDGKLKKADGKGLWWDGLDPQDLYAQNHTPGKKLQWEWDASKGSSVPDKAYCEKFYNRTIDLINKYQPDLIYFDDTVLPLDPVSDVGLKIAAHFYNNNMAHHGGKNEAVLFGKILSEEQRQCLVWDIERGVPATLLPFAWQTDTCIQMLADIVSKNGNLLLSIPVRGDGTIDDKEQKVVEGIADWMDVNRECIFGTRPWKIFGEGPASDGAPISAQGFNEGKGKPFTNEDIRFTMKGDTLYAIELGKPTAGVNIKSLGTAAKLLDKKIADVRLLGSDETIQWSQKPEALAIEPLKSAPSLEVVVFKIALKH